MEKIIIKTGAAEEVGESNTTNPARLTLEDRSLRSCAQNAVVISVLTLSDPVNKKIVEMVVKGSDPVVRWHEHQNQFLRQASHTKIWLLEQMGGDYMKHVKDVVRCLVDPALLHSVGFLGIGLAALEEGTFNTAVMLEDDFSHYFGMYVMALALERQRR